LGQKVRILTQFLLISAKKSEKNAKKRLKMPNFEICILRC